VTRICLQLACNDDLRGESFKLYAIWYWTTHLQQASTTGDVVNELLRYIHQLFNSQSLDRWVINSVLDRYSKIKIFTIYLKLEEEQEYLGHIVK
jgi:hypothetical protein